MLIYSLGTTINLIWTIIITFASITVLLDYKRPSAKILLWYKAIITYGFLLRKDQKSK